jgi:transcriptional regulator with XRE-family HTH domain
MSNPAEVTNEETQKTQADPETAERFIAEKRIGERIRRLRLKKSMGLVELGKHTGLSASFLSQLETGRVVPTLRNLARIAMVFSKDLSYFFETEPTAMFRIHRQKDRVRLPQTGVEPPTYFFESLGYMVPDGIWIRTSPSSFPWQDTGSKGAHASGIRVSLRAGRGTGASPRRSRVHAGCGRCSVFRCGDAALVPVRGEKGRPRSSL